MSEAQTSARRGFFRWNLTAELAPYPGRMAGALRTMLAASIALSIMLPLQIQAIGNGLYMLLLVSYEQPKLTLRTGARELLLQSAGIATALVLVAVSGNSPMARLLGVAATTMVSSFIARACRAPFIGIPLCVFSVMTLSAWEQHLPAQTLVEMSLWPLASSAVAIATAVAVEYCLHARDPLQRLEQEIDLRLKAVEHFLHAAQLREDEPARRQAARQVGQLALQGQTKMQALVDELDDRDDAPRLSMTVAAYARLLDLVAALARRPLDDDVTMPLRLWHAAEICAALRGHRALSALERPAASTADLLGRIETTLAHIIEAPGNDAGATQAEQAPVHDDGFWADAFSNPEYLYYSLRISLCATLCYVIYNALAWPGIATAVPTVLITGLGASGGANKQKQLFRIAGSMLGGVVAGCGALVFLLPNMDSVTPLVVLVSVVMFIAAWIARSPHIGYVGMQIGFSFTLVALSSTKTATSLTPARDRIVGVALGLAVMWLLFDRLWSQRTSVAMRATLVKLLRAVARLAQLTANGNVTAAQTHRVRARIAHEVNVLRQQAEAAPYEFGPAREQESELSERLNDTGTIVAALALDLFALLHDERHGAVPAALHRTLATELERIADAVASRQDESTFNVTALDGHLGSDSTHHLVARYRELCAALPALGVDATACDRVERNAIAAA